MPMPMVLVLAECGSQHCSPQSRSSSAIGHRWRPPGGFEFSRLQQPKHLSISFSINCSEPISFVYVAICVPMYGGTIHPATPTYFA
eukprot:scaffold5558_cov138-Skeletonema_menzelii.AAC.3